MYSFFLSEQLFGWFDLSKGESQTSELRGGKYAARIQEGYEKDGSPKYRYFKTQQEYKDFLANKGSGKKKGKKKGKDDKKKDSGQSLEAQQKEEQKESRRKQRTLFTEAKSKKQEVETTKKSLQLYIEVTE